MLRVCHDLRLSVTQPASLFYPVLTGFARCRQPRIMRDDLVHHGGPGEVSAKARAARPICSMRSRSSAICRTPSTSAGDIASSKLNPVTPSSTTSRTPPTREATTGRPAAIASTTTRPKDFHRRRKDEHVRAGIGLRERLALHIAHEFHRQTRRKCAPARPAPDHRRPAPAACRAPVPAPALRS